MPVRGTLILSRRHSEVGWPVPFLAAFSFPSVATRYPFAAGWTVSGHPNYDPRVRLEPSMFRTAVKRSNHLATRPRMKDTELICQFVLRFSCQRCDFSCFLPLIVKVQWKSFPGVFHIWHPRKVFIVNSKGRVLRK